MLRDRHRSFVRRRGSASGSATRIPPMAGGLPNPISSPPPPHPGVNRPDGVTQPRSMWLPNPFPISLCPPERRDDWIGFCHRVNGGYPGCRTHFRFDNRVSARRRLLKPFPPVRSDVHQLGNRIAGGRISTCDNVAIKSLFNQPSKSIDDSWQMVSARVRLAVIDIGDARWHTSRLHSIAIRQIESLASW